MKRKEHLRSVQPKSAVGIARELFQYGKTVRKGGKNDLGEMGPICEMGTIRGVKTLHANGPEQV